MKVFRYLIVTHIFLSILATNGYTQSCNSIEVKKDPFTKQITATSELISPNSRLHFGYHIKNDKSYLRVRYRKDIGYAIGYDKPADLPTIDRNTNFWVLFDDETVIKISYQGERKVAEDPRDYNGPADARTFLVMSIRENPRNEYGRIKSYHVSATGEFLLNQNEIDKLKNKSISMVRIERNNSKTDAKVNRSDFIRSMIKCVNQM